MNILKIAGITVAACFAAVLLRRERPEQAVAVSLLGGAVILAVVISALSPVLREIQALVHTATGTAAYTNVIFRALGICLLTQLAADTCRDAGEAALAAKTELAGKGLLLGVSLPLFRQLLSLAVGWMQMG